MPKQRGAVPPIRRAPIARSVERQEANRARAQASRAPATSRSPTRGVGSVGSGRSRDASLARSPCRAPALRATDRAPALDRGAASRAAPVAAPRGARGTRPSPPSRRARPRGDPCALLPGPVRPCPRDPGRRYHAVRPLAVAGRHEGRPARELSRSRTSRRAFRPPADGRPARPGRPGVPFEFYADRAGMDSWLGLALVLPGLDRRGDSGRRGSTSSVRPAVRPSENIPGSSALPPLVRALVLGERAIAVAGVDLTLGAFRDCLDRFPRRRPVLHPRESHRTPRGWRPSSSRVAGRSPGIPCVVMTGAETLTSVQEVAIRTGLRLPGREPLLDLGGPARRAELPGRPGAAACQQRAHRPPRGGRRRARRPGRASAGASSLPRLTNDVMPFVNYDLGDWAIRGPVCPCGRGFPTLAAIDGRSGEIDRDPRRARDHARDAGHPACLAERRRPASSPTTRPSRPRPTP